MKILKRAWLLCPRLRCTGVDTSLFVVRWHSCLVRGIQDAAPLETENSLNQKTITTATTDESLKIILSNYFQDRFLPHLFD
jgi:hypothetical protein